MTKFKITIDKDKCIGCGACTAVCEVFKIKAGKAFAKENPSDKGCVKESKEVCPVEAIELAETE